MKICYRIKKEYQPSKRNIFGRLIFALLMAIGTLNLSFLNLYACTGIYISENNSQNSSIYYGRSEDHCDNYCKIFGVAPAEDWDQADYFEDVYGFKIRYPKHTYKYTYIKDAGVYGETMKDKNGNFIGEAYAEAGVNEMGVSVSATVSTACNEIAGEVDPLVAQGGIREISIASVLLGYSSTAREGVLYLASILDEHGAGESNSLMIGDANEVWYFEILTGHQYIAVKLPKNGVSVQPNMLLIGAVDLNDRENVIASKDLVNLAREHHFLVMDKDGNIDVGKTYASSCPENEQCERYLQGQYYLKSKQVGLDKKSNFDEFSLLHESQYKFSTLEVLKLLAYRGQDSAYNMDKGSASWAIGNKNQVQCHVFEIRKNLPKELATIQWQALADAEFSIYIPYYSALIDRVNAKYHVDSEQYAENSINWVFSEINAICYDFREEKGNNLCGENISKYFEMYQSSIIRQQEEVDKIMSDLYKKDKEQAKRVATALGMDLSEQTYQIANSILMELDAYIAENEFKEPFIPSAMLDHKMPIYNIAHAHKYMKQLEIQKTTSSFRPIFLTFSPPLILDILYHIYISKTVVLFFF